MEQNSLKKQKKSTNIIVEDFSPINFKTKKSLDMDRTQVPG